MLLLLATVALAEQHVVDNQDGAPEFTLTGDDWTTWETLGYGFDSGDTTYHYLSHTVGGSDRRGTATWQAEFANAGTWRIETWWRLTENRTADADHVITDGLGSRTRVTLDQRGDGASGWVSLGEYWCDAGFGGCVVTLDGTDDDDSDAANAVRFTLLEAEGQPPETDPCAEAPAPGTHEAQFFAGSVSGSGWESDNQAAGEADGQEAYSPNVDSGEVLRASAFNVCDPDGEETIDRVVLAVKSRTQYDSGQYALELRLDAGGSNHTTFTGTSSRWRELDITADAGWTWATLAGLTAQLSLHDHPGGFRDSDAWADAFRLTVTYTTQAAPEAEPEPEPEPEAQDSAPPELIDTGDTGLVDDWSGHPGRAPGEAPGPRARIPGGCSSAPGGVSGAWLVLGALLLLRRRLSP